jgi:hypothetical protein
VSNTLGNSNKRNEGQREKMRQGVHSLAINGRCNTVQNATIHHLTNNVCVIKHKQNCIPHCSKADPHTLQQSNGVEI